MGKLIKDPLVHFLLAGAVIFAVSRWLNPPEPATAGRIVVSAADVAKMRESATLIQGRPPTDAEAKALIDAHVREEVLYREALAAGLERDDTVVRNRLIEKMRFLTENVAEPPLPTDAELTAWFNARPERFRIPPMMTFEQVFFGRERRGDRARTDAAAALSNLRGRKDSPAPEALAKLGDPLPLWNRYDAMPAKDVALAFGDDFAAGVQALETGTWQGPIPSRFGWHLVRVVERMPERQPGFAEVRAAVQTAYLNEQRQAANEERYRAMRERYDVVVEAADAAPEPAASPAAAAQG